MAKSKKRIDLLKQELDLLLSNPSLVKEQNKWSQKQYDSYIEDLKQKIEQSKRGIGEWKSIEGYEGFYEVSNLGEVKSLDRYINVNGIKKFCKGKILKTRVNKDGYVIVSQVLEIYNLATSSSLSQRIIAEKYGVSEKTISCIKNKTRWKKLLGGS